MQKGRSQSMYMKMSAKLSLCAVLVLAASACTSTPNAHNQQSVNAGNTTMIEGHHLHAQTNVALQADPTLTQTEAANTASDLDTDIAAQ